MLQLWVTVTTVVNTALGVVGLGVAVYAVSAKPPLVLFYCGVAAICIIGAIVGFVNMWFLHEAARRSEEKNRPIREERERKKAERAAKRAEREALRAEKQAAKAAGKEEPEAASQGEAPLLSEEDEGAGEEAAPEDLPPEDNGEITVL